MKNSLVLLLIGCLFNSCNQIASESAKTTSRNVVKKMIKESGENGAKETSERISKDMIIKSSKEIAGRSLKETSEELTNKAVKKTLKESIHNNQQLKHIYEAMSNRLGKNFADGLMLENAHEGIYIYSKEYPTSKVLMKNNIIWGKAGSLADAGPINEFLVDILPNKIYIVDNVFIYKTDELGRVSLSQCDLTKASQLLNGKRNKQRNRDVQKRILKSLDGRFDKEGHALDDGGHLFANNTGGPNELINQVPLDREVNQHGVWRQCEMVEEKALKLGQQVTSTRRLLYEGNCKRPYAIEFTSIIDGVKKTTVVFNN